MSIELLLLLFVCMIIIGFFYVSLFVSFFMFVNCLNFIMQNTNLYSLL